MLGKHSPPKPSSDGQYMKEKNCTVEKIYTATLDCHLSRWSQLERCGIFFRNMRISLHINVADHPRGLPGLVFDWQLLNFVLFLCVHSVCKCELITVKCQHSASVHLSVVQTLKRRLQ